MSQYNDDYDDGPRRYHSVRTRRRNDDDPDYVRDEVYIERGKGVGPPPTRELVYRGREDSIEDIDRDFPPPSGRTGYGRDYDNSSRRSTRNTRDRGRYDDDYYSDDDGYAAAGAAAGYAGARRAHSRRRGDRDRDYSPQSRYSDESSRRPEKERRKSGIENALEGLGLGGAAAALLGKNKKDGGDRDYRDDRARSRSRPGTSRAGRSYRSEGERSRSRDGGDMTGKKWAQAAQAALIAGAIEAVRARNEPGAWTGEKGKRIATAAIGAGGIDRLLDKNPNEKSKRHLAEAVIGGLVANRVANGPRSKSRGRDRAGSPDSYASGRTGRSGRSRSILDRFRGRSQSRGPGGEDGGNNNGGKGIKELVAGGALAAAGAAVVNRLRSKSRQRKERDRDSSADSYVPIRNRRRDIRRRRSPRNAGTAAAAGVNGRQMTRQGTDRGLAARDTNDGNGDNDRALAVGAGGGAAALAAYERESRDGDNKSRSGDGKGGNLSDSSSTTSMENKRKKMRWKETITAGLAAVATIHAAHGVYSSMEAHEKRHRLVAEGEMSPEEARKKQSKAWVQDAAAVGIAALGIKGAFSEWKEMNEQRREIHELEKRKRERRKRIQARKKQEEADHREEMLKLMDKNPQAAMYMMHRDAIGQGQPMPMMYMPPAASGGAPPPDQSGNPYAPRAGY